MIVLGLDTALGACQAAVLEGSQVLAVLSEPMQRGHQERLAGMVGEVMNEAGVRFADLDRLGVTVGPGSFTGVRVGLAFAKGLALALGLPLAGMGTLRALAVSVDGEDKVAAVIDAKRGQLYLQSFLGGAPLDEPRALAVESAYEHLGIAAPRIVVGPGAHLLEGLPGAKILAMDAPDPRVVARFAAAEAGPIAGPRPLYLRAPDARTSSGTPA